MQNALNMPMLVASTDTGHQLEYPMVHIQSVFNEKMVLFCHTLLHHHYLISLHFFFQNAPKNVTDAVEDAVAPAAVWMVTTGWAARTTPLATEVLGCVVKANLASTGEVMTRLPLYALLVPYGFVAVTVIGKVPELDGVPVTAPVLVLNVVPVGKVPTSV